MVTFLTPVAGIISDKVGRTTHMIAINLLLLCLDLSGLPAVDHASGAGGHRAAGVLAGGPEIAVLGPLAALMSELLPAATRATGLGLGYNIGVTLFGGMGPVIMTWLGGFALIGDLAPGYYLTLVGILSLSTLITIRRTSASLSRA